MKTIHLPLLVSEQARQQLVPVVDPINIKPQQDEKELSIVYYEKFNTLRIQGALMTPQAVRAMQAAVLFVQEHLKSSQSLCVMLRIDQVNASGVKMLMSLINTLRHYKRKEQHVTIGWRVSATDEEMIDMALDLSILYDLVFEIQLI